MYIYIYIYIYVYVLEGRPRTDRPGRCSPTRGCDLGEAEQAQRHTPDLPTNIVPTNIY